MTITQPDVTALWKELQSRVDAGDRFAGLFATKPEGGALVLSAHVAVKGEGEAGGGIDTLEAPLPPGAASYPALTPRLGAAFWYEREIHDRFGVIPEGHPRLAPAHPARLGGRPRAAPARRGLRDLHDPARPGPLRRDGIDRVPGRDAGRGHPAPEHAGVLQAPRRGEPVRRDDGGGRRAAGRTRRGHRLGRPRPGLQPRGRSNRGLPAASGRGPGPGAARRT